jgi:putative Mg2+ transporter-C (MgtC) family protein
VSADWPAFGEVALRLGSAALSGILIGLNRDVAGKPMGARTLALVALGAAIVTVAAVTDPIVSTLPDSRSRVLQGVLQGVLAGIGFIGAGVIVRASGVEVRYLTTAATVWATAALGIACGLGEWILAGIGVTLTLLVLAAEPVENAIVKMLGGGKKRDED